MGNFKENVCISIFCLTYNHAPYIRDAIESFLIQETEYPYHIFIFDDASDDGTSEIIKEYQNKYPEKIDIYIAEQNTYGKEMRNELLTRLTKEHLTGKYIALCEGDDFWIDRSKLQLQVEFMESHSECSMITHDALQIDYKTGEKGKASFFSTTGYLNDKDIILKGAGGIPTASFMMRSEVYFWPDNFPRCGVGDWPRQLFAITKGKVYYLDKKMSIYRRMHTGSWTERHKNDAIFSISHGLGMIEFLRSYDIYTGKRFHFYIRTKINSYYMNIIFVNNNCNDKSFREKIYSDVSRRTNGKYDLLIERIERVSGLLYNNFCLDEKMDEYIKMHKYIVVMGMGEYSKNIIHYLRQKKIVMTGYILSNDQEINENSNIRVWRIKEYPYSWEKTCVIVALHPHWQEEVENSLKNGPVFSYYAPFWLEDNWFCRN